MTVAASNRLDGKVALVTGAARGQGRAEAQLLSAEGADVIGIDICAPMPTISYATATPEDLEETAAIVAANGRRFHGAQADVRDLGALEAAVQAGVAALGRLDVVVANAGISGWGRLWELTEEQWSVMIDTNLSGAWHTFRCTIPLLIEQGDGGSIIAVSSVGGLKGLPGQAHYVAAKHGLVGLARAAAVELGPHGIRVNSLHPWGVDTAMVGGGEVEHLLQESPHYAMSYGSVLPIPLADPLDIAKAVVFLASDDSRCITGLQFTVDMGATAV
jgi:SDR family mycofactocin-dependent oxidoreductase